MESSRDWGGLAKIAKIHAFGRRLFVASLREILEVHSIRCTWGVERSELHCRSIVYSLCARGNVSSYEEREISQGDGSCQGFVDRWPDRLSDTELSAIRHTRMPRADWGWLTEAARGSEFHADFRRHVTRLPRRRCDVAWRRGAHRTALSPVSSSKKPVPAVDRYTYCRC